MQYSVTIICVRFFKYVFWVITDVEVDTKWFTQHGPFCVHFDSILSTRWHPTATNTTMTASPPPPPRPPKRPVIFPEPKLANTGPPGDLSWVSPERRMTSRPAGSKSTHPGDEKNWL